MNPKTLPLSLALLLAAGAAQAQPYRSGYGGMGGLGGMSDGLLIGGASGSEGSEECRRNPTSTACIHEAMRAEGRNPYGPVQQMGQSPDVQWADPNCTRIPCRTVGSSAPTNASANVQEGDPGFIGPPRPNPGPQPFGSAEEAQKARDEAVKMGINAADLVVLPNNTVLQRIGPGQYSTMGRCSGGPCSGMPQSSSALDSQFIAAKEQERRAAETAADEKSANKTAANTPPGGGMNANNLPGDGGGQSLNPDRPNTTGTGGSGKGTGGQTTGTGSGGGRDDGNVLGLLSNSISGTGGDTGTGGGDAEPQAVIKVAGSTIAKPTGKLGSEKFEFNAVNKAADAAMGVFSNAPVGTNPGGVDNLNVPDPKPTQAVAQ